MIRAEEFKNPDKRFRPYCFWFLNDACEKEHITDMAVEMERKGLSPGYPQDRGITDKNRSFLTDEFFDTIRNVLEHTSLPMGFCDEAGGMYGSSALTEDMPRGRSLSWEIAEGGQVIPDCYFAVSANLEQGKIVTESLKLRQAGEMLKDDETAYAFSLYHGRSLSGSEIDYLDSRSSEIMLREVYEKWRENLGEYFGNRLSGIFMDLEGDFGYKLAYHEEVEKRYEAMYQDSFRRNLPLLFLEDTEGRWMRARYRYFAAVTEVYSRFFATLAGWCRKNGIAYTGHFWEENLYGQVMQMGDFYKLQKKFDIIGVDSLRLECFSPREFKEAQTIADREKKGLMCEVIGCAGFGLSPLEIRRAMNALTTWGVTQVVLHGIYSSQEIEKKGFAPDMYQENPYWRYFNHITDYAARISYMNSVGSMCADTVLFCPIDSMKALVGDCVFDRNQKEHGYLIEQRDLLLCRNGIEMQRLEENYNRAIQILTDRRIQFYIYDEQYFETEDFEGIRNIVLPTTAIVSKRFLKKLAALSKQGVTIHLFGTPPYASLEEGKGDPEIPALLNDIANPRTGIDIPQTILLRSPEFRLRASHRREGKTNYYWLYNDTGLIQEAQIELKGIAGRARKMNCENGELEAVYTTSCADGLCCYLHFEPYEGCWLAVEEPERIPLTDWKETEGRGLLFHADETGYVTYRTTVKLQESSQVTLAIDEVYHMAEVLVNGQSAGARLWNPYEWDLTELVRPGENTIEIVVGNLMCSSLKDHGDRWQVGIHRRNPQTAFLTGLNGTIELKRYQ
ncbi:MAG: hypothetical protein J6B85_04425 [Lachnospiraceae bacterium]|nr:hypothetical protein [Lachnospiraceae bacterium]